MYLPTGEYNVANGDLNSQESDRAFALQEEYKELYKQGEKE